MKIFEIRRDEDNWRHKYGFNARHLGLPGAKCSLCNKTGGSVGLEYPLLTLPPGIDPAPYREGWPVKLDKWKALALPLRKQLDVSLPLRPGTVFGPFEGMAYGKHGDFTWGNWTLLISPVALTRMRESGIKTLAIVTPKITTRGKSPFLHLELHIEPLVSLSPLGFLPGSLEPCPGCGRISFAGSDFEKWGTYRILRSSIPDNLDIFRVREIPARILVSERFAATATSLGLTNAVYSEIETE